MVLRCHGVYIKRDICVCGKMLVCVCVLCFLGHTQNPPRRVWLLASAGVGRFVEADSSESVEPTVCERDSMLVALS
jgi:hypothetical protein